MEIDRHNIYRIISDMLDNPDKSGIYPTSTCFTRLELYIEGVRAEALGYAHASACIMLDKGGDPRLTEVPLLLDSAKRDLNKQPRGNTAG